MKILILNGSPKGSNSITLQTSLYLQKRYPAHDFEILHVGSLIKSLEKDFSPAAEAIEKADLLLFPIRYTPSSRPVSSIDLSNC